METDKEVYCKIYLTNGESLEKRFDTCEEAWQWQRETTNYHKKRRAKKDRLGTIWSFYCGCTCYGNTYGGWLVGGEYSVGAENLDWSKHCEFRLAERRINWKGHVPSPLAH